MITAKVDMKIDLSGLEKLRKQFSKPKVVQVGWIDSEAHWYGDGVFTTAALASNLHYWSRWGRDSGHSFMIDSGDTAEVNAVVTKFVTSNMLENPNVALHGIGIALRDVIKHRIETTSSPANADSWAARKGSDHPLMYGSNKGESPNLLDEVTYRIGDMVIL